MGPELVVALFTSASSFNHLIKWIFAVLALVAAGAKAAETVSAASKGGKSRDGEAKEEHGRKQYRDLKVRFFGAYFWAILGDWLQGPYVYQLYAERGVPEGLIAVLFLAGFGSSCLFGTFTGPLADRLGRKKLAQSFCLLGAFSCATKVFCTDFWMLLLGRIVSGIATSLYFSVFESWYVCQHQEVARLPGPWMASTFSEATFASGLLAILAGVGANGLVDNLGWGPAAPFAVAVVCMSACFLAVTLTWDENYGDRRRSSGVIGSYKDGLSLILQDGQILRLGLVQSLVESCMYTFVFLWTPVLTKVETAAEDPVKAAAVPPPLGLVFSCFMVCIMIGSCLFSALIKGGVSGGRILQGVCAVLAACTAVAATTAAPWATPAMRNVSLASFLVLEAALGVYFPAIGCLRGELIPEDRRATIANWFRVPMNVVTCATLLAVNHPSVAADKRPLFAACTALLVVGAAIAAKFEAGYDDKRSPHLNRRKRE